MLKKAFKMASDNKWFLLIILIGICLRGLWIKCVPTLPVSDFLLYHKGAISMLQGSGFRIYGYLSAYEPIGYPALLALIYKIFGVNILIAKLANLVLSTGSMILVYFIVKKSLKSNTIALCAMVLIAILPLNIVYTSVLSTEITFTAFYLVVIYMMLLRNKKISGYILLGIILGILSLIKPYMMVFQFVVFMLEVVDTRKLKKPFVNLIIITVFMGITIVPWTIRNYRVFNKVIPISTNGGYNLYVNNNPFATGAWQNPFKIPQSPLAKYKHSEDSFWDEVKVDEEGKKLAYNWIINNPSKFISLGFIKLKNTFITPDGGEWATLNQADNKSFKYVDLVRSVNSKIHSGTIWFVIIYFAILLIKLIRTRTIEILHIIIILNLAFYFAITFVFEGQPRYLFPLWPVFIIIICYVFWFLKDQFKSIRKL